MTDLLTEDPFVAALVSKWVANKAAIDALDEQIKSESLGKTKVLNAAVAAAGDSATELVAAVNEVLDRAASTPEVLVGILTALRRGLKVRDEVVSKYVEANVVEVPEDEKLSQDAEALARVERKKAVDSNNAIRGLLEAQQGEWFAAQGDGLVPKLDNLKGAFGARGETGKRLAKVYQWKVGDTLIQQHQMGAVASFLKTKVAELRKAIEAQIEAFDWENPPANFQFTYGGKVVVAEQVSDDTPDDNEPELSLDVEDDEPEDFFADDAE